MTSLDRIIQWMGIYCGVLALACMGLNWLGYWAMPDGPGVAVLRDPSPSVSAYGAIPIAGEER